MTALLVIGVIVAMLLVFPWVFAALNAYVDWIWEVFHR